DNLLEALGLLARDGDMRANLEKVDVLYVLPTTDPTLPGPDPSWPAFRLPLADVMDSGPFPFSIDGSDLAGHPPSLSREDLLARADDALQALADRVAAALPDRAGAAMPEIVITPQPAVELRPAWFAIRCVYERPNCVPFEAPLVSEATEPFQMAG